MGQEVICTARWGGKSLSGKALLETSEIIFRSDARLKIPFSAIRELSAVQGELRVKTDDGLVVFELGDRAEKWREKIANPKSVVEKLGVKSGHAISVFGELHPDFLEKLNEQRCRVLRGNVASDAACIFLGVATRKQLNQVRPIASKMPGSAALWVVYPKGQTSITESQVIEAARNAGLKDVKVVAFSATQTALKVVTPVGKR
jgi:hypothetical protein